MKTFYKFILLFILGFNYNYSQITTTIDEVYVNSQTNVTNCGTIDFGTTQNNHLVFYYTLTKTSSNGEGYLKIKLKYNSSNNGVERGTQYITSNLYGSNNEYSHTIATNIDASEVQVSGSSIYLEFTEISTPFEYHNSCEYSIEKDEVPTFELDPSSVGIPCLSTSPVTFTVTNVYNSPGTLEYQWSIGSGWIYNGNTTPLSFTTTTNSITLTPLASPPSNVSVVPVLDDVEYDELTTNVTLSNYSPSYTITGADALCSTATYTIVDLPSGTTVQSWSTSNPNIATVSTLNATQAELTAVGNGTVTVTATVINACGQTANINSEPVFVGNPEVTNTTIIGGSNNVAINTSSQLSVNWSDGATGYYWFITTIHSSCPTGGVPPKFQTGSGSASTITTSYPFVNVLWGDCTGDYIINCRAINSCGSTDYKYKSVTVYDPNSGGDPCDDYGLKIKSNPIKGDNVGIIMYRPAPGGDPCDDLNRIAEKRKTTSYNITLYDFKGYVVHNQNYKSERVTLNNLKLKSGIYILNITSSDGISKQKTLVVK